MSFDTANFGTFEMYFGLKGTCSNDELRQATETMKAAPQLAADLAAARAENVRLREALEGMLKWFGKYPVFVPIGEALEDGRVDSAIKQARAALAPAANRD